MPSSSFGANAAAHEVRDCVAVEFAVAISEEHGAVAEILEFLLAHTDEREKWRVLRQAIGVLKDVAPGLRGNLEARIRSRFDAKLSAEPSPLSQTQRFNLETLALVPDDEVQEEIAIGNAARRLREATGDEFFALNTRLEAVLDDGKLTEDRSPVHARVFARALLDVLSETGCDAGTRIAAFNAFDPAMLNALPKAYRAANDLLLEKGVLPDLRRSYGAPSQVPGARASMHGFSPAPAQTPKVAAALPQELGLFDQLLAKVAVAPAAVTAAPDEGLVTLKVRPELVEALRSLESQLEAVPTSLATVRSADAGMDAVGPGHSPVIVLRAREQMAGALTPSDILVADLVAAMFRRLFADPEVSNAAKLQLAALQLPVFKAVMADRRFFTDPVHPVRGLIDVVAELGASGDSFHVDGKLPEEWVEEETRALLETGQLDTEEFAAARDRLAKVTERHHEVLADFDAIVRSVRREDAELGAVRDASLEVAHRVNASECTQAAADFIYRAWRPVLTHVHRTLGAGSAQWKGDLETLDNLLWALGPRASAGERERLAALLPAARFQLWRGLIRAQMSAEQIQSLLEEFDGLQERIQRAPLAAAHANATTTVTLTPAFAVDSTTTLHVSSSEMVQEGISRGAWFEFTEEDGSIRRARIAWASPIQGACVFKDVARNKSFAISLADLREKRDHGLARMVDGPGVAHSSIEGALQDVARDRGAAATS